MLEKFCEGLDLRTISVTGYSFFHSFLKQESVHKMLIYVTWTSTIDDIEPIKEEAGIVLLSCRIFCKTAYYTVHE